MRLKKLGTHLAATFCKFSAAMGLFSWRCTSFDRRRSFVLIMRYEWSLDARPPAPAIARGKGGNYWRAPDKILI